MATLGHHVGKKIFWIAFRNHLTRDVLDYILECSGFKVSRTH